MTELFTDVTFGSHMFVRDDKFLLLGDPPQGIAPAGTMQFYTTYAMPLEGAFLLRLDSGWRFVAGPHSNHPPWRYVVDDLDLGSAERASALAALGDIQILSIDKARENVQHYGRSLQHWDWLRQRAAQPKA